MKNERIISLSLSFLLYGFSLLILIFFGADLLQWWLGQNYNDEIFRVARILFLGWVFAGVSQFYLSRFHSIGEMKIPATLHLVEMIIILPIMFVLIKELGALGAAISWTVRFGLDAFLLTFFWNKRTRT